MSLYLTELRRLFKRRATKLMLILIVLGLGTIVTAFVVVSHKNDARAVAIAEQRAQNDFEQQSRFFQQALAECEAAKARGEDMTQRWPPDCSAEFAPRREDARAEWYMPYEFDFAREFEPSIMAFAGVLMLFAFVVGASFIGAEWSSGGMMNLLLWRPKRLTVLFTKLGALLTAVLGITAFLGALWTLAFWLIGRYDGKLGKVTPGLRESLLLTGARGVGLVLLMAAVAFALASLGRHTAMALGGAVGVIVVSEIGIRIATSILGTTMGDRYVLSTYAAAWFLKELKLYDYTAACVITPTGCEPPSITITWQTSAVVFGVGAAAILVAAIWSMHRRDVT